MEQPGGGYVDALFYVLPSVRKICQLVDRSLDLYKPILGKHVEASSSLEHDRSTGLASNPTMIMNDVDQIQGHIEPGNLFFIVQTDLIHSNTLELTVKVKQSRL